MIATITSSPILFGLLICLAINLLVFGFAYNFQTDKLTDITYASSFAILALLYYILFERAYSIYRLALLIMVVVWAVRLGGYLLRRILRKGVDHRFDNIRPYFKSFLKFYLLQTISIWIVSLGFIEGLTASESEVVAATSSFLFPLGVILWAIGLVMQTVADAQKFSFRNQVSNDGKYMDRGLFSIVRFPNYTGEILVWIGIFVVVIPVLQGIEWFSIVSPLWIIFLLVRVSGIPFLERSNAERYGHLAEFLTYQRSTKKLIPGIW